MLFAPDAGRAGELDPGGLACAEGDGAFCGRCGDGGTGRLLGDAVVVVVVAGGCVEAAL